jgi:hypothetical protein
VVCEDASHRTLQIISGFVILFVAFGIPITFAFILLRAARDYKQKFAMAHREVADRVSKDMDVDISTAAWVIRDVTIGRDFSFLMDAYVAMDYM